MMKTISHMVGLLINFIIVSNLLSQNPQWINHTNGDEINAIAIDGDDIWVGTRGGFVMINNKTRKTTFYNKANSGLPHNGISCIAIDENNNKWIGAFGGGLAVFNENGISFKMD